MTNPASNYVPYDDWFDNPLDSMPIATNGDDDMLDTMPSEYQPPGVDEEPPRPEEEVADNISMHEKMYRMATARYNPFHVGGSENAQSEVDYIKKHSPWPGVSERFQGGSENASRN